MIYYQYYKTDLGELVIGDFEGSLCLCDWRYRKMRESIDERLKKYFNTDFEYKKTILIENITLQLNAYIQQKINSFDVPISFAGTAFQKKVWDALLNIPYGQTKSYMDLAKEVSTSESVRAVASANGANAISIIVPCHRVIGSKGDLVGYAGGLAAKKYLLKLESAPEKMSLFY